MLWPGFEFRVALRFLREGRMQTVLIIVGVAAGVAVIAYISALINGLQANTLAKTLGAQAHITLKAPDDLVLPAAVLLPGTTVLSETQPRAQRLRSIANWQALLPLLEKLPNVAGVSPMVSGAGLALRGEAVQAIALMGVDLDRYDRVVGLRSKVVSGTARLEPGESILGREVGQMPSFEAVRGAVVLALRQQSFVSALRQYLQLLAGQAEVEGVQLDSADTPLVQ